MNTQEAYEQIRAYFSRPGAELAPCWYRTPDDGRACAIGCLIPDALYDARFEGKTAEELCSDVPAIEKFFADVNRDFLEEAQGAHDVAADVEIFLDRLDGLAVEYGLRVVAS